MTKKLFIVCAALVWTVALVAQNISVVAANGSTKLYRTLQAAIEGADPNSVIYLPGGGFPIADSVKITKKLTIIGIGHKAKNENADGITLINGNLFFNEGSSDSAVMGCYITGSINIGCDGTAVNDVLIKYCDVGDVVIYKQSSTGTIINQNYIRSKLGTLGNLYNASAEITNNVVRYIYCINGGIISNNIITGTSANSLSYVTNSVVSNNIFLKNSTASILYYCSNNSYDGNMGWENISEDGNFTNMSTKERNDVFVNYNGGAISPASDFHFKDEYKQYENQVGVYANGVDFDKQMAPAPYIVAKHIDDHTDASGKLNIKIRVKASGEE